MNPSGPGSTTPPGPAQAPLPRTPFVMLGLMTLATLAGPLAIILTLRGGRVRTWPPDRPIEWITFIGVVVLVLGLLVGCVALAARARRREVVARGRSAARGVAS